MKHSQSADLGHNNYVGEDCLTLNIYRPVGQEPNLPVAIWIHGYVYLFSMPQLTQYRKY